MSNASKLNDWTKPAAAAIPKEGYFTLEQGRYGPTYPRTPACHGFTHHREDQAGDRRRDPRLRQEHRRHDRREPTRARPVAAPLPAMGALRHRSGQVLHVPGHFRYRFRQVHRRRRSALQSDRCRYRSSRSSKGFPRTGRRTPRRSSSSCASTSVRASSSTANTRTCQPPKSRRRSH